MLILVSSALLPLFVQGQGSGLVETNGLSLAAGVVPTSPVRLLHLQGITQTLRVEGLGSAGTTFNVAPTLSSDALLFTSANGDAKRWSGGTSILFGRDASGILAAVPFSSFTISADNGTNISSNTVKLGGSLLQNTDVPLAGFKLNFSGVLGSVTFGTKNLQANYNVIDSGGIYAFRSGSTTTEVIRAVQGSTNAGAYGSYRADVNGAGYTSVISYMGYHSSSGKTFGFYTNSGDFSAWFEKGLGIGGTQPATKTYSLDIRNIFSGGGNPAILALRQSTTSTTTGNPLGSIYFGSSKDTIPEAQISVVRGASGSGGAADYPTDMVFYTSTDGPSSVLTDNLHLTFDGKIGLHKTAPTEALDLIGNFRLSGAFMPNNLSGTSGQYLISGGAGVPPTWGLLGQLGGTTYGSSALTLTSNGASAGTFSDVPGLTQTITVPANSLVYIATDGGMNNLSSSTTTYASGVAAIFIDGTWVTNGGAAMVLCSNTSTLTNVSGRWSMSLLTTLSAGSHTIKVSARCQQSNITVGSNALSVSSNSTTLNQGELTVIVIKQ